MEDNRILSYENRENFGSSNARRIRKKTKTPAIIYGKENNVEHISINAKEFEKKFSKFTENTVLILNSGKVEKCAFIKEVDENITKKLIYHIDFYEVDKSVEVERYVSINFVGASIGVKEGGTLVTFKSKIKVKSLPLDLPEKVEVDLAPINKGDELTFKDVKLPSNVKLAEEDEIFVILTVK